MTGTGSVHKMKKSPPPIRGLIFVYNTDAGWAAGLLGGAHKVLSPATYSCGLCTLTHGAFQERKVWRTFRRSHPVPMEFLYRKEFLQKYNGELDRKPEFPAIWAAGAGILRLLLGAAEINAIASVETLIAALEERLAQDSGREV